MRKKIIALSLMLAFIITGLCSNYASAEIAEGLHVDDLSEERYKDIMSTGIPDMQPKYFKKGQEYNPLFNNPEYMNKDMTDKFKSVEYYTRSTGATSGIRYRTQFFTFKVGNFKSGEVWAKDMQTKSPAKGESLYTKVTMDREFFVRQLGGVRIGETSEEMFKSINDVEKALDTEEYLEVGAVIEIYNAATGQVLQTINSIEEVDSKASIFPLNDRKDMKTRWQNIPLRNKPGVNLIAV